MHTIYEISIFNNSKVILNIEVKRNIGFIQDEGQGHWPWYIAIYRKGTNYWNMDSKYEVSIFNILKVMAKARV